MTGEVNYLMVYVGSLLVARFADCNIISLSSIAPWLHSQISLRHGACLLTYGRPMARIIFRRLLRIPLNLIWLPHCKTIS